MSRRYNLPEGLFMCLSPSLSGAEKAGIKTADIITKADGQDARNVDELTKSGHSKAGETLVLTIIMRKGYGS